MVNQKLLDLANKINRTKTGSKMGIKPEHPEYRILEPIVTDEMADVALCVEFRKHETAEEIAAKCGKSVEETKRILWDLAVAGVTIIKEEDGVDKYWHELWVPGHMEMIVNSKENIKNHPVVGECFEAYGQRRGPMGTGIFPVGTGVMRTIPIERALDGSTKTLSYEQVSKYLNDNTIFSVSDCSCRTSREVMGEGCGHLKEDMCIQLGDAAEYYIRTGRARKITRDEAFEIIKKAEDNGLMHNIPNTDGPGHTHAICNCCGCSCYVMRNANMWGNADMMRSNFIAEVDSENCVACGECVENCPTNALKLGQKLCDKDSKPVKPKQRKDLPYDTEWGPDKWNPDYRTNREVVVDTGSSPCKAECPAHIGIQGYIKKAAQGEYREALELIKMENPFPAVCGRVCPRYCEDACTRADIDDPIAIDDIKKFIAEQDLKDEHRFVPTKKHDYSDKKIAIVGAGPAGLSCAYYLAIDGYDITVFEKEKELGGMLTFGIPSFRLEKDVINAEIDVLKELGVKFQTGVEIGKDKSLDELRKDGFKAFYLAVGAQAGRNLNIEGEDAEGVITGVDFLRKVALDKNVKLDGPTIVIGGGNVAIDVARTAVRAGSSKVDMFCLENRQEMPALEEEIDEALEEGIAINNSWGPKRIVVENGKVTGVEFKKCISVFNENKRFSPKFDENDTKIVETSNVLISVGQAIDWGEMLKGSKVELNRNNTVKADGFTLQTAEEDIFVGGDALTGPKFAIDAIAQGKEGAISIHRYVQHGQSLTIGRLRRNYRPLDKENLDLAGYDRLPRQKVDHVNPDKSKETFKDLRGTLTEEQVKQETERCLGCGATVVDEFMCVGCGQCVTKCKFDAIKLVRKYNAETPEFENLKPTVLKYAIKRKFRIMAMKPFKAIRNIFS